jgi:hypothetical protein
MIQTSRKVSGIALALAAAGLVAGCQATTTSNTKPVSTAKVDLVECHGVNVCGGHNDCKTASNACSGMASCKGTGWLAMPAKACKDVGGKVVDKAHGSITKADLIQCHGVNVCAGHNDCKTADNACKGHAKCKGTGFVASPAKACKDIGGKVG